MGDFGGAEQGEILLNGDLSLESPEKGIVVLKIGGQEVGVDMVGEDVLRSKLVEQLQGAGIKSVVSGKEITYLIGPSISGDTNEMKVFDEEDLPIGYVRHTKIDDIEWKILHKQMINPDYEGLGLIAVGTGLLAEVLKKDGAQLLVGEIDKDNTKSKSSRESTPRVIGGGFYDVKYRDINSTRQEAAMLLD